MKIISFFTIVAAYLCLAGCSSMNVTTSQWNGSQIKIDGNAEDWHTGFDYLEKEKVLVGIRNDKEKLYICLKTSDRGAMRKIMSLGMTLWLDDKGNKTKAFGIHYPIGVMGRAERAIEMEIEPSEGNISERKERAPREMDRMLTELEIYVNGTDNSNFYSTDMAKKKYKIEVALKNDAELLTYEIAIPLNSEFLSLVDLKFPDKKICLGFESGEFKRKNLEDRQRDDEMPMPGSGPGGGIDGRGGSGMPGAGMPPGGGRRGGGRRGGMDGRPSGDRSGMSEPINIWYEVNLAKEAK